MHSSTATLLEIDGLRSPHGGPFNLAVARGQCVCILGASGAGKSVLLRLVADLDPGDGRVRLHGRDRLDWPAPAWRRRVLYQAAEPAWWAPRVCGHFSPAELDMARTWLPALRLPDAVLTQAVDRLSTGERQRLALLRSLARSPAVLLLDEPTASLDQASTEAVEALIKTQLRAGMAIVLVTHSREQAARLGDRLFELRERQLHAAGGP